MHGRIENQEHIIVLPWKGDGDWIWKNLVMEQPFNNYFSFCPCLLLLGFVDDIIKGQQHESDFILFYLYLSLFGYLLSPISYLLSPYLLISGSYPIG